MRHFETEHLESLCEKLGIDTAEIDSSLSYGENKRILLERYGIALTVTELTGLRDLEQIAKGQDIAIMEQLAEQDKIEPPLTLEQSNLHIEPYDPYGPVEAKEQEDATWLFPCVRLVIKPDGLAARFDLFGGISKIIMDRLGQRQDDRPKTKRIMLREGHGYEHDQNSGYCNMACMMSHSAKCVCRCGGQNHGKLVRG